MKVINIKNETCLTKDLIKRKKHKITHVKYHLVELFTSKNTIIQSVKTCEQIIQNMPYVILMTLGFLSARSFKKLFVNIKSLSCDYLHKIIIFSLPPEFFSFIL